MGEVVEREVEVGGVRIHYAECGAGDPTFVLVHGLGGSITKWLDAMPLIAAAGRVVALDLPGFGDSDTPRARYSPEWLAGGVRAFMDAVGIARAVVVGNSLGGSVALMLAAAWPERVSGLVLVSPALPSAPGQRLDRRTLARFVAPLVPGLGEVMFSAYSRLRTPEEIVQESLAANVASPARVTPATLRRLVRETTARRRRPGIRRSLLATQRRLAWMITARRDEVGRLLGSLRVPTLFLWGTEDRIVPMATGEHWIARPPGAEMVLLEGLGHNPQVEDPEGFSRAVLAFASRASDGARPTGRARPAGS